MKAKTKDSPEGRPQSGREAHQRAEDLGLCSLPLQRLISIAKQSGIAEPSNCEVTLQLLVTSRAVRASVDRIVKPMGLSEARFLTLVTLYILDPVPSCPADLAYHAEITRSAMTDTLDQMELQGWVRRQRTPSDRRAIHIHLTEAGRKVAALAIRRILQVTSEISNRLKPGQRKQFTTLCREFQLQAEAVSP